MAPRYHHSGAGAQVSVGIKNVIGFCKCFFVFSLRLTAVPSVREGT